MTEEALDTTADQVRTPDAPRESRVVIDFSVGPAGVGPPASITPDDRMGPAPIPPPAEG